MKSRLQRMKSPRIIMICLMCFLLIPFLHAQSIEQPKENDYLINKGRFYTSLSFSLSQRKAENENQLIRQVINQTRYNYRILGAGGYAIKDNFVIGLSGGYGRVREEITFLDDNDQEITTNRLEQGFTFAPNMRNYIPLGNGQLQILVQTELGITIGESLQRNFSPTEVDKIAGEFVQVNLGVSPGLLLFFNRNWAFETTVGIAGLTTRIEEEVINDDIQNRKRVEQTNIDLRLNLLALNLGVAYYF